MACGVTGAQPCTATAGQVNQHTPTGACVSSGGSLTRKCRNDLRVLHDAFKELRILRHSSRSDFCYQLKSRCWGK